MKKFYALAIAACLVILATTSAVFAADYDYKTMTPNIKKALKNRQARYYELQNLKQEGVIGENNKGYVTNLKDSPADSALSDAENRDRRILYEALAEQNMLGNTGLLEVQKAFAEVQQDKASPGEMVQSSSGNWEKKSF